MCIRDSNERVRAAGGDHYLGKPLNLDKLDKLLDQYFGTEFGTV